MDNLSCEINLSTLTAEPYNLVLGEEISAKVTAINYYGPSDQSVAGTGAVIQLVPDAPINLQNDPTVTDADYIRFTWTEGLSNGGTPVIDYDVYYDQGLGTDEYVIIAENIGAEFITDVDLTPDVIYTFKVTARNTVGDSLLSASISIRAAEVPDAPVNLLNIPA